MSALEAWAFFGKFVVAVIAVGGVGLAVGAFLGRMGGDE